MKLLIMKTPEHTELVVVQSPSGFHIEIDARFLSNGAGGFETIHITKEQAKELVAHLNLGLQDVKKETAS